MKTQSTPPPQAPDATALVERLKRAIVDCAQEAFDSDNDGYRFTAEAFRFHVETLQSAITHLAAHAELQARCARLEEDGKRLKTLQDMHQWARENCRVVYYPPDGAYPIEHAPFAKKDAWDLLGVAYAMAAAARTAKEATP